MPQPTTDVSRPIGSQAVLNGQPVVWAGTNGWVSQSQFNQLQQQGEFKLGTQQLNRVGNAITRLLNQPQLSGVASYLNDVSSNWGRYGASDAEWEKQKAEDAKKPPDATTKAIQGLSDLTNIDPRLITAAAVAGQTLIEGKVGADSLRLLPTATQVSGLKGAGRLAQQQLDGVNYYGGLPISPNGRVTLPDGRTGFVSPTDSVADLFPEPRRRIITDPSQRKPNPRGSAGDPVADARVRQVITDPVKVKPPDPDAVTDVPNLTGRVVQGTPTTTPTRRIKPRPELTEGRPKGRTGGRDELAELGKDAVGETILPSKVTQQDIDEGLFPQDALGKEVVYQGGSLNITNQNRSGVGRDRLRGRDTTRQKPQPDPDLSSGYSEFDTGTGSPNKNRSATQSMSKEIRRQIIDEFQTTDTKSGAVFSSSRGKPRELLRRGTKEPSENYIRQRQQQILQDIRDRERGNLRPDAPTLRGEGRRIKPKPATTTQGGKGRPIDHDPSELTKLDEQDYYPNPVSQEEGKRLEELRSAGRGRRILTEGRDRVRSNPSVPAEQTPTGNRSPNRRITGNRTRQVGVEVNEPSPRERSTPEPVSGNPDRIGSREQPDRVVDSAIRAGLPDRFRQDPEVRTALRQLAEEQRQRQRPMSESQSRVLLESNLRRQGVSESEIREILATTDLRNILLPNDTAPLNRDDFTPSGELRGVQTRNVPNARGQTGSASNSRSQSSEQESKRIRTRQQRRQSRVRKFIDRRQSS